MGRPTPALRTQLRRPLWVEVAARDQADSRIAPDTVLLLGQSGLDRRLGRCSSGALAVGAANEWRSFVAEPAFEHNGPGRVHRSGIPGWAPLGGNAAVCVQTEVRPGGSAAADVLVLSNPAAEVGLRSPGGPWLHRERKGPPQCASG